MWNYEQVLTILRDYSDLVVALFARHAHAGGYCSNEELGIHFRIVEAVLENTTPAYAILHIWNNNKNWLCKDLVSLSHYQ